MPDRRLKIWVLITRPPSYEALFKNRFASHVCQTLFEVAVDSVAREVRQLVAVPHPPLIDFETGARRPAYCQDIVG